MSSILAEGLHLTDECSTTTEPHFRALSEVRLPHFLLLATWISSSLPTDLYGPSDEGNHRVSFQAKRDVPTVDTHNLQVVSSEEGSCRYTGTRSGVKKLFIGRSRMVEHGYGSSGGADQELDV
jgi:hypothetical protein